MGLVCLISVIRSGFLTVWYTMIMPQFDSLSMDELRGQKVAVLAPHLIRNRGLDSSSTRSSFRAFQREAWCKSVREEVSTH